ncbi:SMI1 / KNR4 family protein [Paenibacillus sp. P1XP2]|nr:SMI1 / KNR4 family protein [Paenibacillus sp. P1XP2]
MAMEQLARIRLKLRKAAAADAECSVFGARVHKYRLQEPLGREALERFENTHGVKLPEEYAAFLTEIGNGGAGPYYGIHPLGARQSIDLDGIGLPSPLRPKTREEASAEPKKHQRGDNDPPEALEDECGDDSYFCRGLLNIGEQGCSYETMLVVTGEFRGKVVYLDLDHPSSSFFTYEANFLDWYERWLDEVIAGYDSAWFGMRRSGDEWALTELYRSAASPAAKIEALEGMLKLRDIADETAGFLCGVHAEEPGEVGRSALQILAKFKFGRAKTLLREMLRSGDMAGQLAALESIQWYRPKGDASFVEELAALLPDVADKRSFRLVTVILHDSGADMLPMLLPFFGHPHKEFRVQALYLAGKSEAKAGCVEAFLAALEDPDPRVQHTALQALGGCRIRGCFPFLRSYCSSIKRTRIISAQTLEDCWKGSLLLRWSRSKKSSPLS